MFAIVFDVSGFAAFGSFARLLAVPVVVPRVPDQWGSCGYGLTDALPRPPVLHQRIVALRAHERDVLLKGAAVHHEPGGPDLRGRLPVPVLFLVYRGEVAPAHALKGAHPDPGADAHQDDALGAGVCRLHHMPYLLSGRRPVASGLSRPRDEL